MTEHRAEVGLRGEEDLVVYRPRAFGAQAHLARGLLAGHVQRAFALQRPTFDGFEQKGGFAHAGFTGEQHDRTGDHAGAEDAIQFSDAGGKSCGVADVDLTHRPGGCGRDGRDRGGLTAAYARSTAGGHGDRVDRAPFTAFRAAAHPFCDLVSAGATSICRFGFGHRATLATVTDTEPPERTSGLRRGLLRPRRGPCPGGAAVARRRPAR